jgi:hypothetical protein
MEYEPILALFHGFEPFFEARIRIRPYHCDAGPQPGSDPESGINIRIIFPGIFLTRDPGWKNSDPYYAAA